MVVSAPLLLRKAVDWGCGGGSSRLVDARAVHVWLASLKAVWMVWHCKVNGGVEWKKQSMWASVIA